METEELLEYLNIPFSFQDRPSPLNPQLRIVWGLAVLVVILHICCRSSRSSMSRLHILSWAIRSTENRRRLTEIVESRASPATIYIRYDPGFNRAIEYAIADCLVEVENKGRLRLTEKGKKFALEIMGEDSCLQKEKKFLQDKGSLITEAFSERLFKTT
jgi:hypothetical protein